MKFSTTLTSAALALVVAGFAFASNCQAETAGPSIDKAASNAVDAISGIRILTANWPRDAAQVVRDSEGDLLYQHSARVYYWAALAGQRKGLTFDPELLYVAAMFHDYGLTASYGESHRRYEVDGANAARDFLRSHGIPNLSARASGLRSHCTRRTEFPASLSHRFTSCRKCSIWTSSVRRLLTIFCCTAGINAFDSGSPAQCRNKRMPVLLFKPTTLPSSKHWYRDHPRQPVYLMSRYLP